MSKTFQPPPGTRDFYPDQMALRRYIEDTWRRVSLRHGFVEVDGPTFEYLDLYKVKSGDEIVSQLFHFESRGEDAHEFALRPEFTPTLARMIAAKANSLPRPIKWFCIPRCYRAERQQKGRLKEFFQWNVDMLGGETPEAKRQFDLETAALCLDCLREFGFTNADVKLLWNDRQMVEELFQLGGIPPERYPFAFYLLDRIAKLAPAQRTALYTEKNLTNREQSFFEQLARGENPLNADFWKSSGTNVNPDAFAQTVAAQQSHIDKTFSLMGLAGFAHYDASIVRGLAYYTGFVFEINDATGQNRAVAGGGRYDKLIEMFGGPALPAVGFGMGDVVLAILLEEKQKLPAISGAAGHLVDVFVVNALPTPDESIRICADLRASQWDATTRRVSASQAGLSVATSYKTTKNIGKILQDASASGAKVAVILAPAEWDRGVVKLKNLVTREETETTIQELAARVRALLATLS